MSRTEALDVLLDALDGDCWDARNDGLDSEVREALETLGVSESELAGMGAL